MWTTQYLYLVKTNITFVHNYICLILGGASSGNYHYNQVSKFDITTERWSSHGTMSRSRAWFAIGVVDNQNYCTN